MNIDGKVIRKTLDIVLERKELFYDRFFNLLLTDFPALRLLFESKDMLKIKTEFDRSLNFIVNNLDHKDRLKSFLYSLGEAHGHLAIREIHFKWLTAALLKALEMSLEDFYDANVEENWNSLIQLLALQMLPGASVQEKSLPESAIKANPKEQYSHEILEKITTNNQNSDVINFAERKKQEAPNPIQNMVVVLPESIKNRIKTAVSDAFQKLIEEEIASACQEEIRNLEAKNLDQLFKKVI